jgi:hypothetical protein
MHLINFLYSDGTHFYSVQLTEHTLSDRDNLEYRLLIADGVEPDAFNEQWSSDPAPILDAANAALKNFLQLISAAAPITLDTKKGT